MDKYVCWITGSEHCSQKKQLIKIKGDSEIDKILLKCYQLLCLPEPTWLYSIVFRELRMRSQDQFIDCVKTFHTF
uniref:Uncharacterized protein n=1 Tax=Anguilla anguilla TaxID=7936 RepID=A0A0E9QUG4_ANGAN